MLTDENYWQTCSQNPLNVVDLKYCAVKSELLLRSNEVICAMCVVWQCFGGSDKVRTLHTGYMLCVWCVRVRLLRSVEWTPKCSRTLLYFYTQYFNLFVLLLSKLHHRTFFYPTHDISTRYCKYSCVLLMMGGDTTRNMQSSFPEINKLCNVASCWKYIKRDILTMHGPLNLKFNIAIILNRFDLHLSANQSFGRLWLPRNTE